MTTFNDTHLDGCNSETVRLNMAPVLDAQDKEEDKEEDKEKNSNDSNDGHKTPTLRDLSEGESLTVFRKLN